MKLILKIRLSKGRPFILYQDKIKLLIKKYIKKHPEYSDVNIHKILINKKYKISLSTVRNIRKKLGIKGRSKRGIKHWLNKDEIIGKKIKTIIKYEPKNKPYSDTKIAKKLKQIFHINITSRDVNYWINKLKLKNWYERKEGL